MHFAILFDPYRISNPLWGSALMIHSKVLNAHPVTLCFVTMAQKLSPTQILFTPCCTSQKNSYLDFIFNFIKSDFRNPKFFVDLPADGAQCS